MVTQLAPTQLSHWLQTVHGQATVLDVREPFEVQAASVQAHGFTLLHIPMALVPLRLSELDPTQPVACLCHYGVRSQQVAHFLAQHGFTQVANITGGIDAWSTTLDSSVARY
jgi:rhodanese-related sulfurtransferase